MKLGPCKNFWTDLFFIFTWIVIPRLLCFLIIVDLLLSWKVKAGNIIFGISFDFGAVVGFIPQTRKHSCSLSTCVIIISLRIVVFPLPPEWNLIFMKTCWNSAINLQTFTKAWYKKALWRPTWSDHEEFDLRFGSQLLKPLRQLEQLQLLKRQDKPNYELIANYFKNKWIKKVKLWEERATACSLVSLVQLSPHPLCCQALVHL